MARLHEPAPRVPDPAIRSSLAQADPVLRIVDQALGILIFRSGHDADHCLGVLELWARERDTDVPSVAETLVFSVCQGLRPDHAGELVRWIERQLRHGADLLDRGAATADEAEGQRR